MDRFPLPSVRTAVLGAMAVVMLIPGAAAGTTLDLAALPRVAEVDERYQSYNVEMVEVTGGRFWAPYGGAPGEMFRMRPPLDLADPRLRQLARHLAPAYMRVSGSWANNTYLALDGESLQEPPAGFRQVLTASQWRGVVDFSKAVDARIVTSFAVSAGVRGPDGAWTPAQAQRVVDLTQVAGGTIAAAELFNEPNVPSSAVGLSKEYDAAAYSRDFRIFRDWARRAAPEMKILGPSGIGEGTLLRSAGLGSIIRSEEMMQRDPGTLDAVSYHFYGSLSQRCTFMNVGTAVKSEALTRDWLDRTLLNFELYRGLRDKYEPGRPLWNTETAQAGCGGSPWASTFLDTFRYLTQNGLLAQKGVQVVIHNTLSASDYALIDEATLQPRPNFWAAVLWKRTMGRIVLGTPVPASADLRLFAHCLPDRPGVGLLAINSGVSAQTLAIAAGSTVWVMTAQPIDGGSVLVNGKIPVTKDDGSIEGLDGRRSAASLVLPAFSIAFVADRRVRNPACVATG